MSMKKLFFIFLMDQRESMNLFLYSKHFFINTGNNNGRACMVNLKEKLIKLLNWEIQKRILWPLMFFTVDFSPRLSFSVPNLQFCK